MSDDKISIVVFPEMPDTLLVQVPTGQRWAFASAVAVAWVSAPFTQFAVSQACIHAAIDARIIEGYPGKWASTSARARDARKRAKTMRDNEREAVAAAVMLGSDSPLMRERAEVIQRRQVVDEEIRRLKASLDEMAAGRPEDPDLRLKGPGPHIQRTYDQERLVALQNESQALQHRSGELRRQQEAKETADRATALEAAIRAVAPDQAEEILARADTWENEEPTDASR